MFTVTPDETFVDTLSHLIVMKLIECYYYVIYCHDGKPHYREIISYVQRSRQIETGDRLQTFAYRVQTGPQHYENDVFTVCGSQWLDGSQCVCVRFCSGVICCPGTSISSPPLLAPSWFANRFRYLYTSSFFILRGSPLLKASSYSPMRY